MNRMIFGGIIPGVIYLIILVFNTNQKLKKYSYRILLKSYQNNSLYKRQDLNIFLILFNIVVLYKKLI